MVPPNSGSSSCSPASKETWKQALLLSFQCLGVIFGQLSTAPLYVFATIDINDVNSEDDVHQFYSLMFWTLTIISFLKYALIVLRADDDGEGGTFALYSLLCRHAKVGLLPNDSSATEVMHYGSETPSTSKLKMETRARRSIEKHKSIHYVLLFFALFGCCMTIGDGVLTPAISVLSASSGVQRSLSGISKIFSSSKTTQRSISEALERYAQVPSACAILVCLFTLQHYGTHKIGIIFAPIIAVWLIIISGFGIYNILHWNPHIVYAVSPAYIYRYVKKFQLHHWRSLGSIILCASGSEAMFADLGHFSKRSIKITFLCLIYPSLVLCYAGQAAYMSKNFQLKHFNHLSESMPSGVCRHLFVALSLFASAVGSQATITATFSIINQCLALGCFPRVKVIHTSEKIHGQIYIPDANWLLMVFSLTVTISFQNIVKIGNATGLAIILGMLVTTCLMTLVIGLQWDKSLLECGSFLIVFGFVETAYLIACLLDFHKGAWYLVLLVALSMTMMIAWHYGTKKKYEFDLDNKVSTEWLTHHSPGLGVVSRIAGIGFVYTDIVTGIPAFFSQFITNCPAFHQVLIFVSFKPLPVPYVHSSQRYLIGRIGPKMCMIYRCIVRYGYRDGVRDTDDFEEQIICSIGEFISMEEISDCESLSTSPEGKMMMVGKPPREGNALVPLNESKQEVEDEGCGEEEVVVKKRKKKVRFRLPAETETGSGKIMKGGVREELKEIIEARESGTAYFLGKTHIKVRVGSNIIKKFMIKTFIFLDKNCRDTQVALNIPHAALLEVGMVYLI